MAVVYILNANKLTTDISKYSNIDKKRLEKIKKSNNTLFIKEQLDARNYRQFGKQKAPMKK